ncbi:reverse transcriptase domain-containing protein [Tanacetum coccineum]
MPNNVKTYDGTEGPEDHQKKYVKDSVKIHNIKQRDGETIEEFIERFKVETGRMKGAPECMRISKFMHGVNNPELTKRLNEHVPKTMEEMMITTTTFIRGEAVTAGKKKGHISWRTQDQSKRHGSEQRSNFREIKQGRDQLKVGKKEVPTKDKSMAIYMIQPWHRMTRQKVTQSFERVSKITFPSLTTSSGTEGPLVIEVEIGGYMIHRMYVDGDHSTRAWMNFMIVRLLSPYNGIIGRPGIREIQAVPSTAHKMLKFPVDGGIVTIHSTILIPAECATMITSSKEISKEARVCHENFKVALHLNFPDQEVAIRGTLSGKGRTEIYTLLKKNLDIFAWQPSNMTGVPRSIAEHRLNIREGYSPVRQKKRGQAKAIQVEVQKLVGAGIMREVYYHEWIVTPFRKLTGKLNLSAATPLSVSWTLTKVITRYRWQSQTKRKQLSTPAKGQVGRNIEVYIDDLVIKSHTEAEMLRDIDEMFRTFLSKSAERSLPLFKTLNKCIKKSDFHWTPEAEQAFKQLKQHLSELPLLVAPTPKEEVIVYLSATHEAICAILMTKRGTVQTSVYFRLRRTITKMERHAGRTQYHLPAKDVGERTDPGGLPYRSGASLILTRPKGTEFTYALRFQFTASNNESEYEALIAGLRIATQVPRSKNKKADALSKIASTSFAHLSKQVLVEILKEKSIQEKEVEAIVENEASKLRIKARQYELLEGVLYRRSFLKPWLRCGGPLQVNYVIREIHEGSCSMHAGPRSVVAKAMRLGYYWPTMHRDARDMIRASDPFSEGPGKVKFFIVAMDYFTKWIEAKAVAKITVNQVKKFVWDNIVCHFGLPGEIILENDKQFSDNPFKDWCEKLNIA